MAFYRCGQSGGTTNVLDSLPTNISTKTYMENTPKASGSGGFTMVAPVDCTITIVSKSGTVSIKNTTTDKSITAANTTLTCSAGDSLTFSGSQALASTVGTRNSSMTWSWTAL